MFLFREKSGVYILGYKGEGFFEFVLLGFGREEDVLLSIVVVGGFGGLVV